MKTGISLLQFFSDKEFSVPVWEVALLVFINSICILFGRYKLGLFISYFFVFYWGFMLNRPYFVDILGNMTFGLYLYVAAGIIMTIVIIIGLFIKRAGD
jgi:hypothetical protein